MFPAAKLMTNVNQNAPYDLNLDGARINVKAAKLYQKKRGKYFEFMTKKNTGCDYLLLVGYQRWRDKDPLRVWLIPAKLLLDKRKLTLGPNHQGQWSEFEREFVTRRNTCNAVTCAVTQLRGAM
jgi:hypothetical protein